MPAPGGYCTAFCAFDACPAGSACVSSGRGGEMCAARCTRDADCRVAEGYVCDPGHKVCSPPFASTPVIAACKEPVADASGFSTMAALTTDKSEGAYQFEPSAVVTPSGDLVALYTGGAASLFSPSFLGVVRVPADGSAPTDTPLPTTKKNHFDAWTAIDRSGTIHGVWLGHDGGGVDANAEIGYARSRDGGRTWTTPVPVHEGKDCPPETPFCLDKPMIAIGPDPARSKGEVIRVFYTAAGEPEGMKMRSSVDGGETFGPGVRVMDATYGDVAIDAKGVIHVVALDGSARGPATWGSSDNRVIYVRSADGKKFGAPVSVSGAGESVPFYFSNPSVVVDAKRALIYVGYIAGTPDGKWTAMLATSKDGGATWTRKPLVGGGCHQSVADLAIAADGTVHATWNQLVAAGGRRLYTRCAAGGGACQPAVALGPPMTTYELVRHSPRWLGEYTSLVVDDKHDGVHAVWTQVAPGATERGTARIVHARGKR